MKPTLLTSLVALALGGSVWAASPYDLPYGVQWSFIIGHANADNPNSVEVSPDGTIWVGTGGAGNAGASSMHTWGSADSVYGGSWASGYGQINRLGGILQGNDIPNMAVSNFNQTYSPIITFAGSDPKAYFGSNPNRNMLWTDASPPDTVSGNSQPMTFSVTSVLGVLDPYRGYKNGPGDPEDPIMPRENLSGLDPTEKFTHEMVSLTSYGGSAFDFKADTNGSLFICRGAQGANNVGDPLTLADSFTAGDHSGLAATSYKPAVGRVFADGTLDGPTHQPSADARTQLTDCDLNESLTRFYACASGNLGFLDPDGPGPLPAITFDGTTNSAGRGYALVYDYSTGGVWSVIKTVTWESTPEGGEGCFDILAMPDGGFALCGDTDGSMPGFTNPAPGTRDGYIERYDAAGALVWSYQAETTEADFFGDMDVDSDGSIYVSGNGGATNHAFVIKFSPAGSVVWRKDVDNGGTVDSQRDGKGDKHAFFLLSEHNPSSGTWPNTIDYVPQGTDEVLLQRLSPGDFDSDGFVSFADVQIAGAATQGGPLAGDDTYDFNEDGDSTTADVDFMIATIMDRAKGDIHQDSVVTDVDNADIGRAIGAHNGAAGSGKVYLDGDIDFDGDVDDDDVAFLTGAFTGAKGYAGAPPAGSTGTTLTYIADKGTVWLDADSAAGGVITSFQLENGVGTFLTANYNGPTGGTFGGTYEDVTTSVLADTDTTVAGFSGELDLGKVFPTGMDEATLNAYLATAVYTGAQGTGQMDFDIVWLETLPTAYETWADGFATLTDIDAGLDFEGDGLVTGIEYMVGGDPTLDDYAMVAPTGTNDGSGLVFTYRRTDLANDDPDATIAVDYSVDLDIWKTAVDGTDGVSIPPADDDFYGAGIDRVIVNLPSSLAVGGKLFARLTVGGLPETIFSESFDNTTAGSLPAGWTAGTNPADNSSLTAWELGTPATVGPIPPGVPLPSADNCVATNIGANYDDPVSDLGIAHTDIWLRTPAIDLNGISAATLTFQQWTQIEDVPGDLDHGSIRILDASDDTVLATLEAQTIDGATTGWEEYSMELPAGAFSATNGTIKVEFQFEADDIDSLAGWYIDNVVVR